MKMNLAGLCWGTPYPKDKIYGWRQKQKANKNQ